MFRLSAAVVLAFAASSGIRVLDLTNRPVDPFQMSAGAKAIVFLFTATDCPISNRYAPEVQRLYEKFSSKGVQFYLVYPNPADEPDMIREHEKSFGYPAAALRDPRHALARRAHATVTPEAAVFVHGDLAYHGRIDDRFVELGVERPAPTVHDLDEALTAVLNGVPVPHPVTQSVGCFIADFAR
jgi:AhpC/TSA family